MRAVTRVAVSVFCLSLAILVAAPVLAATDPLAPIGAGAAPPQAPIKPVTETLHGVKVTDDYRYMEKLDPATLDWMNAEGAYTRKVLDAIKPLAALQKRVSAFTGSFGFVQGYVSYGGRAFYEERAPGADDFDLIVRDAAGTRKLVDIAALRTANGGKPYAINWFLAAPDGSKVAVGVSEGGSENAAMTVYDAASGKAIGSPIDRVRFGATAWSPDSKTVYFNRLRQLKAGEPETDTYKNSTLYGWNLRDQPFAVLGAQVGHGPRFAPEEFPVLAIAPGSNEALALSINGVQNEWKAWVVPVAEVANPKTAWKLLVDRSDEVTGMDARSGEIFLLSHKDAPTFKVLAIKAGEPLSAARTLLAAQPNRVIERISAASDALYVLARKGAYSQLLRIPVGSDKAEQVALPFEGHIGEAFTDPRQPGITLDLSSWVVQPTTFRYDPVAQKFAALDIGHRGDMDAAAFKVSDLEAKAADGVMVPLSLIQPKAAKGAQITLVEAYGSYGISNLADFSTRRAAAMREGITYGICHVRGGGEKGESWRLGGKDANKHHTWQDLIACGEDLIARGITTKDKLFIIGGSAGGITVGRAMTERPDLFAGVIDLVPAANTLRAEFSPNGPPNVPEFGTVKDAQGFKNLYAMDSVQHVKHGVTYPAVLITTGLNDPRVSPWEPAKFAAALQASGTPNPVLLRIDAKAGHGVGSTRTQTDQLTADWIAFMFWRAGDPGWRPDAAH
ncbi:prolyl oligopeptidase family serine peptidase [Dokdonella sp.]|uniref:prolyl oligopeptidase family serine peptidase n=1 Tax=Dokdonella sp. TaxID=2291710 RepID=UPI0031BEFD4E|nr:prolyl oligopeptidase family serine peptidase [Dokdonella sp.]